MSKRLNMFANLKSGSDSDSDDKDIIETNKSQNAIVQPAQAVAVAVTTSSNEKVSDKNKVTTPSANPWNRSLVDVVKGNTNTTVVPESIQNNRSFNVDNSVTDSNSKGWISATPKRVADSTNNKFDKSKTNYKNNTTQGGFQSQNRSQGGYQGGYQGQVSKPKINRNNIPVVSNTTEVLTESINTRKFPDNSTNNGKMSYASMAEKPADPSVITKSETPNTIFEKKTFGVVTKPKVILDVSQLPTHYLERDLNNKYQIQFSNPEFIRKVAGAEKSTEHQSMYRSLINCAIEYYSTPDYMMKNPFYRNMMTTNQEDQEKVFLIVLVQITAFLIHRLIKSDSVDTIKIILDNLPLFDVLRQENNKCSNSSGSLIFQSIRNKWIEDRKIINGISKSNGITDEKILQANERINNIKKMFFEGIFQSEWNGNNLFHSAMYYGAPKTMDLLIRLGIEKSMYNQINTMLNVRNLTKESFNDLIVNGIKDAEKNDKKIFITRKKSFEECKRLYLCCLDVLRNHFNNLIENDANKILSDSGIEIKDTPNNSSSNNNLDDINVLELIQSGDTVNMIDHITQYYNMKDISTVEKTFNIWKTIVASDSQYEDYLNDVLDCKDIEHIIRELFPERFN